ncbi:MAG TPA: SDR family NAD(P)-dependent oxidoreductase [Ignavibacteriaceae bacterium]|nr:SDR family NAD(P)-dependent oxidoreductase [Ignavibacteriaceae bacterium]
MILKDKVVLLTGASSGIGYQLAKDFANEGAKLALLSRRLDILEKLSQALDKKTFVRVYKCDVTIKQQVHETVVQIKKDFGKIDIAILNSGVGANSSALDYNSDAAEKVFNTNVLSVIYFIEQLIPDFISEKRGAIVGLSSLGDGKGFPKSGFYSASKAALTILLESLRIELKKFNVKVVTVKPGFIKTPMTDKNKFKMPFLMNVEKASLIIINGLKKDKRIIEFPWQTTIGAKILRMIPTKWFEAFASNALPNKK